MLTRVVAFVILALKFAKPLLAILAKGAALLTKFVKGASATKLALGVGSFGVYSVLVDWRFAVALLLLIGIHESGHVWAMRRVGMATRGFYFIPFFGGAAVPESAFPSAWAEGYVALMGPIWGLIVTAVTAVAFLLTGNRVFEVAACWMAFVNLLNLIPVFPLDGGRVVRSLVQSLRGWRSTVLTLGISALAMAFCIAKGYYLFAWLGVLGFLEESSERRTRRRRVDQAREHRADIVKCLDAIRRCSGAPAGEPLDRLILRVRALRKDATIRPHLERLAELRRVVGKYDQRWTNRLRRRREKFLCCSEGDPRFVRWVREFADGTGRRNDAHEEAGRITVRLMQRFHSGPPLPVSMEASELRRVGEDVLDESPRLMLRARAPSEESADGHCSDAVADLSYEAACDCATIVVNLVNERAFARLIESAAAADVGQEWEMSPRRTVAVAATYATLAATLFLLMAWSGGHEAAAHAVEFFQSF